MQDNERDTSTSISEYDDADYYKKLLALQEETFPNTSNLFRVYPAQYSAASSLFLSTISNAIYMLMQLLLLMRGKSINGLRKVLSISLNNIKCYSVR
jgi:hypothetical protein